jgi:uncharacterized protein (DUF433 family)
MTDDELIAKYVEPNPDGRGLDEARLKPSHVSVWAIVGYYEAYNGKIAEVAKGFDVPDEAVEAAMAYYRKHKCLIDNRIAANTR